MAPNLAGESFGIVVAEGMAAGCAVVASDLAAFRDVAPAARFVEPGDRPAWRSAVVRLLDDAGEVRSMGERARSDVQRFDWSIVAGQYHAVYRRAIERPTGQS